MRLISKTLFATMAIALMCSTLFTKSASADVIVSTLGDADDGQHGVGYSFRFAAEFSPTSNATLSEISLELSGDSTGTIVQLFSNMTGTFDLPDSSLATLSASGYSDFVPTGTVDLNAGVEYWVVVGNPVSTNLYWGMTADTTYTGTGTLPLTNKTADSDSPATGWSNTQTSGDFKFEVQGDAVSTTPEPGGMAFLAALGASSVMVFTRRRLRLRWR